MDYQSFINSKRVKAKSNGIDAHNLNENLFPFQRDIVKWALRKGRSAIFADCGLGKTLMQLEWANQVHMATGKDVLILAPLAVSNQTVNEGRKFGINVTKCREQSDVKDGINITNYEILHKFDASHFIGIVLDESSILKSFTGKIRNQIISEFEQTPFKLACTATPSPNDHMELGNHSEFLGAMDRTEMLAMFFVHDGGDTAKWRLKGHAKDAFWDFVASWAVMVRSPKDLGYSDDDSFQLPELKETINTVENTIDAEGRLFAIEALTLSEQQKARKESIEQRVKMAADMINGNDRPWIVWCDYNNESEALTKAIHDAVEVKGSDTSEHKEDALIGFSEGRYRVIVTKPSIAGFGMNWQHCSDMCFVGLSHSYEQYYQAIRRSYRFGQKNPVNVQIVISDIEQAVVRNVMRKKEDSADMIEEMVSRSALIRDDFDALVRNDSPYIEDDYEGEGFKCLLGDCVQRMKDIQDESIGFSIFSPPFASLYTYSNSDYDMGNSKTDEEFAEHFQYMIKELYRVMMPGRLVSFHCMNLPTSKERDGFIGIKDFRGELIRAFQKEGFIYHSEVTIWKDPVTAMQRTKALGLLNKQKNKDSSLSRQGIPDYLVTMRKPGDNPERIDHTNNEFPISMWQKYASPVWMDINPSRTLQHRSARENNDERHICPLQLDVIDRAIDLWSKPGDVVLSPFMGIGSEGYEAIIKGRSFIGIELKASYFKCAVKNLNEAVNEANSMTLFDFRQVGA